MIPFPDTPLTRAALAYATEKHAPHKRWGGEPFIVHPIRVAQKAVALYDEKYSSKAFDDPRSRAVCARERELIAVVAYCHDTVEDCEGVTEKTVADHLGNQGLLQPDEYISVITALTRLNKHHYPDYCVFTLAAKGFWLSRFVKISDISDNLGDKAKGSVADKYRLALHILNT